MRNNKIKGFFHNFSTQAAVSFFIAAVLCSILIVVTIINRSNVERLTMEQVIMEKSIRINEVISKLLYKTHALSALVIQNNGEIEDFERISATIVDDPAILNILIAPNGVVSNVYPLYGNEAVIGHDFFGEGEGNKEAVMARDSGSLVFGGPFNLVQGGQALVGRLPIFIDTPEGENFWGLVSVTLKYPEVLDSIALDLLEKQGFAYEIWRTNPDNDQKQIIANSDYEYNKNSRFIEKHIKILNADWYCRISPVRHWYEYPETWALTLSGLCVSILVAYLAQNNTELKTMKLDLEKMARLDPLTEIFNRRYFMDLAYIEIEKSFRQENDCYIIMFDLDFFKRTNDNHGHLAGDEVLKSIAKRVKGMLRPYDLLARFGGEEFIILVSDMDQERVLSLVERIRKGIAASPVLFEDLKIEVSASFGVAKVTQKGGIEKGIQNADEALYHAKRRGRNRTVIFNDTSGPDDNTIFTPNP